MVLRKPNKQMDCKQFVSDASVRYGIGAVWAVLSSAGVGNLIFIDDYR